SVQSLLLPSFPTRRSSDLHHFSHSLHVGDKRIMRGTLRQNFMFKSKTCEMCIVDLNIAKALGNMHIHTFFFISVARLLSNKGLRSEEHTSELQSRFDLVCR